MGLQLNGGEALHIELAGDGGVAGGVHLRHPDGGALVAQLQVHLVVDGLQLPAVTTPWCVELGDANRNSASEKSF